MPPFAATQLFGFLEQVGGPPPPPHGPPNPQIAVNPGDSLATIQSKANGKAGTGGSVVFPANTTFNFGGGSLIGVNGVTFWSLGNTTITNGDFDMTGKSGWTVQGQSCTQFATFGFIFSGTSRITANSASGHWVIANNTFNDNTPRANGFSGSALDFVSANLNIGADSGLIINCNFNRCQGNATGNAGGANCNNITFDGCQFVDVGQGCSLQFALPTNTAFGNNIVWIRNAFERCKRACLEFGPTTAGPEYMNGLQAINNWFGNFNRAGSGPGDGMLLAISFVALGAVNTTVQNNFFILGPTNQGWVAPAIEFAGSGDCSGNISVDFSYGGLMYKSGWNCHDNVLYNDGHQFNGGWVNNGSPPGTGTFSNNVSHGTFPGPTPPYPTRRAYP